MRYLLDTCLLSELVKPAPEPSVTDWVAQRKASDLFVSALTMGELHRGVAKLAVSKRRTALAAWLQALEQSFDNQMLPFTHETARVWAKMSAPSEKQGRLLALMDSLLELERGVMALERRTPPQGSALRVWLTGVKAKFAGRILPFNENTAAICASLHVPDPKSDLVVIPKAHTVIPAQAGTQSLQTFG